MDGRDGIAFRIVATLAVFVIHHLDIAEGDIRCGNIKCTLQLRPDGLKAVYRHIVLRVQSLQDATCQQVLLKGTDPHIGIFIPEGIAELADTCRWVEHRPHLHPGILHHLGDGTDDGLGCVESGIHAPLDAVGQLLGLPFVLGTFTDGIEQFLRLFEISLLRLVPILLVFIGSSGLEHELQATETAVSLQDLALCIRRSPALLFQLEHGTDSRDVIL